MSLAKSLRVMVVDDMTVSRGLLTQALEELGIWNVESEGCPQSALRKLAANPVHLVLSDYNMPNMDGLQLLRALRQNNSTQRIGFILVTGTPSPAVIDAGKRFGMNNLLKKPFSAQQLQQVIEAVVGKL